MFIFFLFIYFFSGFTVEKHTHCAAAQGPSSRHHITSLEVVKGWAEGRRLILAFFFFYVFEGVFGSGGGNHEVISAGFSILVKVVG